MTVQTSVAGAPLVEDVRYDHATVLLHWTVAGLVIVLWAMGRLTGFLPKGSLRLDVWSVHILLGFLLAALLAGRIIWRASGGSRLPPAHHGGYRLAALAVHAGLYLLLIVMVASGIGNVFVRAFNMFGVWHFPRLGDESLRQPVNHYHNISSNVLIVLALCHAVAAFVHRHLHGVSVLRRMRLTK